MREILAALQYLHEQDVVHRDIKPANILLTASYTAKLCDFGFARKDETAENRRMTLCGTDEYMAPEIMFDEEYHAAADMFAFGLVLAEIITRRAPGRCGFLMRLPQHSFAVPEDELRSACAAAPPSPAAGCPASLVELCAQVRRTAFLCPQPMRLLTQRPSPVRVSLLSNSPPPFQFLFQLCSYDADGRPDAEGAADWVASVEEEMIPAPGGDDVEQPPPPPDPGSLFHHAPASSVADSNSNAVASVSPASVEDNAANTGRQNDGAAAPVSQPGSSACTSVGVSAVTVEGGANAKPVPGKSAAPRISQLEWPFVSGPARVRRRRGFRLWRQVGAKWLWSLLCICFMLNMCVAS